VVFCLSTAACASDEAVEKRFKALQEEVDRVQSRADRLEERLTALEVSRQKQIVHLDDQGDASIGGRPELKVIKVAPKGENTHAKQPQDESDAAGKDQGPRPVIRASGSAEGRIENLEQAAEPGRTPRRPPSSPDGEPEGGN